MGFKSPERVNYKPFPEYFWLDKNLNKGKKKEKKLII